MEKPEVFSYEDILAATDGFSEANLLGHGTYGSLYYGLLHDQVNRAFCHRKMLLNFSFVFNGVFVLWNFFPGDVFWMITVGSSNQENDCHKN